MNKEQLKELNYPIVIKDGEVIAEEINDFQCWLFEELVDLGTLTQEASDIIDFNLLEDKYSYVYEYVIDEDDLLRNYQWEDLKI